MEREQIKDLYKYISNVHKTDKGEHNDIELSFVGKLRPTLRKYQERAVKWMLHREMNKKSFKLNVFSVELPSGGILADEMGLGKTVEVLACILSNPLRTENEDQEPKKIVLKYRSDLIDDISIVEEETEYIPQRKRRKATTSAKIKSESGLQSSKYAALRRNYEAALLEMSCVGVKSSNTSRDTESIIRCFCDNNESDLLKLVECDECKIWQHAECLGIDNQYKHGAVKCPQCWSKSEQIHSKTTLIITPNSIRTQWVQEIKNHVCAEDFKYLVYEGVKNNNYIQPPILASYDVILTSYNVLCSELNYINNDTTQRSLRHAKKYYSPSSPLTCLKWWRVCLDEAQMVEGYTTKTATMASQLDATYRWAVTGTPIQKSIHDLYGLIHFLRVELLSDSMPAWLDLLENEEHLFDFLSEILWRSSKEEVNEELGVPPQTVLTHWLHFTPIEGHFYRTIHTECESSFKTLIYRFPDLDIKIVDIERRALNSVMKPLLAARQACTHPQVVRGRFVRFKHTMTMEELMAQMVIKAKTDADGALRQLVSSLHGIAAIHIILCDWKMASEYYRRVLQLNNKYESIKVDTLQMIHCLHNLSELLDQHGAGIPPTLRDSELKKEAKELEMKYLEKYSKRLSQTQAVLAKMSANVGRLCQGHTLSFTGWWNSLIKDFTIDEYDMLVRIRTFLDDNVIPGQQNMSSKLNNLQSVHREVAVWLADADKYREEALAALRKLEILPLSELIDKALLCHVNKENKRRKKASLRCLICTTEEVLKTYEAHIFSINKVNLNETWGEDDNDSDSGEAENREEKELKNVKIFKSKKEGSWKPSSQERIIQVLANYAKRINYKLAEEGTTHLTLLESVRKEFKWIRAVWRNVSDQVYATDELCMAKQRLRLYSPGDDDSKTEVFVIFSHDIPFHFMKLENDSIDAESDLKRTTGTLFYLQNLQKSGSTEMDCPVCKDSLDEKWSVLNCGHCCCFECIPTLLQMGGSDIECPLCRVRTPKDNVSYVKASKKNSDGNNEEKTEVKGDHSTKVTAVISKLLSLLEEDPSVKVLIFSTWEKVLDIVRDALIQNEISFRRLESGDRFKTNLAEFKSGSVTVLLLPVKQGSKGLNLTEATHLFFVEPILNPAEEQQAVGRIHRIGQTKPTFVHRFVVSNTIEEKMFSTLETSAEEEWLKENITLRKLNDLFVLNENVNHSEV